jgi:hypothetical protein
MLDIKAENDAVKQLTLIGPFPWEINFDVSD